MEVAAEGDEALLGGVDLLGVEQAVDGAEFGDGVGATDDGGFGSWGAGEARAGVLTGDAAGWCFYASRARQRVNPANDRPKPADSRRPSGSERLRPPVFARAVWRGSSVTNVRAPRRRAEAAAACRMTDHRVPSLAV